MVRYADDLVVLGQANHKVGKLSGRTKPFAQLSELDAQKTAIVDVREAGSLGYHFERGTRSPRSITVAEI